MGIKEDTEVEYSKIKRTNRTVTALERIAIEQRVQSDLITTALCVWIKTLSESEKKCDEAVEVIARQVLATRAAGESND